MPLWNCGPLCWVTLAVRSWRKVFEVVLPRRQQRLSGELVSSHLQALCMGVESSGERREIKWDPRHSGQAGSLQDPGKAGEVELDKSKGVAIFFLERSLTRAKLPATVRRRTAHVPECENARENDCPATAEQTEKPHKGFDSYLMWIWHIISLQRTGPCTFPRRSFHWQQWKDQTEFWEVTA